MNSYQTIVLENGAHLPTDGKACFNELCALLIGDPWTDKASCFSNSTAYMFQGMNDQLLCEDDYEDTKRNSDMLIALAPRAIEVKNLDYFPLLIEAKRKNLEMYEKHLTNQLRAFEMKGMEEFYFFHLGYFLAVILEEKLIELLDEMLPKQPNLDKIDYVRAMEALTV